MDKEEIDGHLKSIDAARKELKHNEAVADRMIEEGTSSKEAHKIKALIPRAREILRDYEKEINNKLA